MVPLPRLLCALWAVVRSCRGAALRSSNARRLDYQLAGFRPMFLITDEAAIDQDQRLMVNLMAHNEEEQFLQAWQVYRSGAFSRPYAVVQLEKGLPRRVPIGTNITGRSDAGLHLDCEALEAAEAGDTHLKVRYRGCESLDPESRCAVGANPHPILTGCLTVNGALDIRVEEPFMIQYVYNRTRDNLNDRAIEQMSKNSFKKMRACSNCPYYSTFRKFEHYYGSPIYGDKFVLSAFRGGFANFTHGDADFRNYDFEARAAAIKTASSFMIITQYILQELEHSIDKCDFAECKEIHCLTHAIQSMEAGVAYYTGSLEGPDGNGRGYLLYALADEMCKLFKTCGPNGDKTSGSSKVNIEIFEQFREMHANILAHQCTAARTNRDRITVLMSIPLVQATLYQAYIGAKQAGASLVDEARGAAFAASVVPIVADCATSDGNIIYSNMKTGKGYKTNFEEIKAAFENNYECMRIKCSDIGGYWFNSIAGGFYIDGFYPCDVEPPEPWTAGQIVGFVIASLAVAMVLWGIFKVCRYFHFFGMCKSLQKRARRRPVTVRAVNGISA